MSIKLFAALFLACVLATPFAAAKNAKPEPRKVVDSGAFAVLVNGKRIATEKFSIEQGPDVSVATSELTTEGSGAAQHFELQLTPTGDIRRYEWREQSPGKARIVVEPTPDGFLVQHSYSDGVAKPQDKPYLLAPSTLLVDDYSFSQREILLWRYLAAVCSAAKECHPGKTQLGTVIPHQMMSAPIFVEYAGREKTTIRGTEQELDKFILTAEDSIWTVWMDTQMHIQRIVVPAFNTEIVRD